MTGGLLILLLAVCTVTDLSRHRIYNWATYSAFLWALLINALCGRNTTLGTIGLNDSLLGAISGFGVMLIAYQLSRGGAGDVKLAVAIGAWLGVQSGILAIACSYIVGGAFIVAWTFWERGPLTLGLALLRKAGSKFLPQWIAAPAQEETELLNRPIPLAAFFAIGTLLVMFGVSLP